MNMNRFLMSLSIGVALTFALSAAGSGSATNAKGKSGQDSTLVAQPADSSSGQGKAETALGSSAVPAEGKDQREKFDEAEKAIEASSDKIDNNFVKAVQEQNRARRKAEKAGKTP